MGQQSKVIADLGNRWQRYFRERYDDERLVQFATDAAVRALLRRASSEDAANAGTDAVNEARRHPREPMNPHGTRAPIRPPAPSRPLMGYPSGRAIRVQERPQLVNGWTIYTINFVVEAPDGTRSGVSMRGSKVSGGIREGDDIEVLSARRDGAMFKASRVFNRTMGSELRVESAGIFDPSEGIFGQSEAQKKGVKIFVMIFAAAILVFIAICFVFVVSGFVTAEPGGPPPGFPTEIPDFGTPPPGFPTP